MDEKIRRLYIADLLPSREIADILGISKTKVAKRIKAMGISRNKSEAVRLSRTSGRRKDVKGENNPRYINGVTLDKDSGIYFLIKDCEIVYVGKSESNTISRINRHIKNGKDFNEAITFQIGNNADIHLLEIYYILTIKPLYNIESYSEDNLTLSINGTLKPTSSKVYYVGKDGRLYKNVNKSCPCLSKSNLELIRNLIY